jgi:hypothetical protein
MFSGKSLHCNVAARLLQARQSNQLSAAIGSYCREIVSIWYTVLKIWMIRCYAREQFCEMCLSSLVLSGSSQQSFQATVAWRMCRVLTP